MSVSYKKLWKLLIDKDMKKKDLEKAAGISNYDAVVLMGLFTFLFSAARRFITTAQTTTSTAPTRTAFPKRKSTI